MEPYGILADIFRALIGVTVFVGIGFLLSSHRKSIDWKLVFSGIALQVLFALLLIKVPFINTGFQSVADFFVTLLGFSREGSEFLFGSLVGDTSAFGYIFAFQVLPTILFFAALSAALFYLGILQKLIYGIAWVMSKTMRLSGPESLAAAANIFIGQTEAPLLIKPYLSKMSRSEILCLMTGGMATVAGGVLAAYIGFLGGDDPEQQRMFSKHLLTASILNAPAGIVMAKLLFPEMNTNVNKSLKLTQEKLGSNFLDAITKGIIDGLKMAVNVGAVLLVFVAFIAMINYIIMNGIGSWGGINEWIIEVTDQKYEGLSLQLILGVFFAPFAWAMGVPYEDVLIIGQLLGEKTVLNEFYAYISLGKVKSAGILTDPKSLIIATYALCGFANLSSIGIQIGGISALAPERRSTIAAFGIKALIGGTLACFLTATLAGLITS